MFTKAVKPDTGPAKTLAPMKIETSPAPSPTPADPGAARKSKVATLIAEHMTVEGGIAGDGELHVDGVVRGDIRVNKLTIGESGHVEGTITAESVENRGRIVGAVTAKQVRLYATAYVDGDVTHEQLAMELGAFFQGRSLKFQRPAGGQNAPAQPATLPPPKAEA
jgi:cytoskeletal protein CcmA (bactofilin family)